MSYETDRVYLRNIYGGGQERDMSYDEPNECPICKKAVKPNFLYGYGEEDSHNLFILFQCNSCKKVFLKSTSFILTPNSKYMEILKNTFLTPNTPIPRIFNKYIEATSPSFIKIYNESKAAESYNLYEIAGMGYRKALEFLIKDYIISKISDDAKIQKVKSKFLGNCIKDDITSPQLKAVAEQAAWLGNDETHYVRKYENKDINDLKLYIDLTTRWIETELITEEIMNPK